MPARVVIDPGAVDPDVVVAAAHRAVEASPSLEVVIAAPSGTVSTVGHERLEVLDAGAGLRPDDDPGVAVRARADLPVRLAVDALGAGRADAVVSLGPAEAVLTAARFALPRRSGVRDPVLAVPVEPATGARQWLLDVSGRFGTAPTTLVLAAADLEPKRVGVLVAGQRPTAAERDRLSVALDGGFAAEHVPVGAWPHAPVDVLLMDGSHGAAIVATLAAVAPATVGPGHVAGLAAGRIRHLDATPDVGERLERTVLDAAEG